MRSQTKLMYLYSVKKLALFLMIAFTLLGNVGIKVFTHSCEEEGTFISFVAPIEDHCKEGKSKELPSCCKKAKEIRKDCCSDEEKIVKLSFDFHEVYDIALPYFNFSSEPIISWVKQEGIQVVEQENVSLFKPPTKAHGRSLLIYNQVFLI